VDGGRGKRTFPASVGLADTGINGRRIAVAAAIPAITKLLIWRRPGRPVRHGGSGQEGEEHHHHSQK